MCHLSGQIQQEERNHARRTNYQVILNSYKKKMILVHDQIPKPGIQQELPGKT
jgi:hypothetical protein